MKFAAAMLGMLLGTSVGIAQTTRSAATSQPGLEALDQGLQQLYRGVQHSLVRVVVPIQVRATAQLLPAPGSENGAVRVYVQQPLATTRPLEVTKEGAAAATTMPMG